MTTELKFVENHEYDFTNRETGERCQGITCNAFEPDSKKLVKVKIKHLLDKSFGEPLLVNVVLSGRYISYEATE